MWVTVTFRGSGKKKMVAHSEPGQAVLKPLSSAERASSRREVTSCHRDGRPTPPTVAGSRIYLQVGAAPDSSAEPVKVGKNVCCSFLEGSEDNVCDRLVKLGVPKETTIHITAASGLQSQREVPQLRAKVGAAPRLPTALTSSYTPCLLASSFLPKVQSLSSQVCLTGRDGISGPGWRLSLCGFSRPSQ